MIGIKVKISKICLYGVFRHDPRSKHNEMTSLDRAVGSGGHSEPPSKGEGG